MKAYLVPSKLMSLLLTDCLRTLPSVMISNEVPFDLEFLLQERFILTLDVVDDRFEAVLLVNLVAVTQ